MDFTEFLERLPLLHSWDGEQTWNSGGFGPEHLGPLAAFLREKLPSPPTIFETGAGCSTIAFLFLAPRRLVSIAPEQPLFDRIRKYCQVHGIGSEVLETHVGYSEWVLPKLSQPDTLPQVDMFLVDGGHGWPTVFIDFFYANHMLRNGGYLMLDDVQLHSVKELARLLVAQPGFGLELDLGKSLVFRKTSDERALPDWNQQPYLVRMTDAYGRQPNPFTL